MTEPLPTARRPFTLLDLMVLVCGVAVGLLPLPTAHFAEAARYRGTPYAIEVAAAAIAGLLLVGPLVMLRGRRLTSRGPTWPGEWMWLATWPLGLMLFSSLLGRGDSQAFNGVLLLALTLATLGLAAGAFVARVRRWLIGRLTGRNAAQPASRAVRAPRVWPWSVANIACCLLGWVLICLPGPPYFAPFPDGADCLALSQSILWVVVPLACRRLERRRPTSQPAPWTHVFGLAIATAPAVLWLLGGYDLLAVVSHHPPGAIVDYF